MWLTDYLEEFTYIGIAVVLFIAGLGLPVPEDVPLIFGGVMAGAGKINVWIHLLISMVFILVGDSCLFWIGRKIGAAAGRPNRFSRHLTPERQAKVAGYFDRFGNWTVFFGRFIAGIRGAIFLTAGAAGFPYARFVLLDFLAALISVPAWIWLGHTFGSNWQEILEGVKEAQGWVLGGGAVLVIVVVVAYKVHKARSAQPQQSDEP